ncbi:2-dehydro-3-deoxy-phosphogluconate aldolase [Streptomyces venezuelae]|uniref:bifunctional 4-hydroxy-2-oxoglutarate aldolase/2-dehydro-3-deoxy-phosphogluconate aldolase n=1 Tax=Streptomyces gardneri TaxID=66892 RepID=UPI0006BE0DD7|nr:bifunctional 4-hydroxy-2-oxoglutarate aldolase/2-dehydro-3-deoxy-phosphogluconate aldolase [Streptomyces gardneri]ALO12429.1 2-dehydro-3-deoxy-phosphogluconate aldolase [Streptomyces venezuelae]QPK49208.1 bifunctional 4-hydroxy-2-oxoglutarate aldolase/2-dehydro-3-deoxy-phosphogluconate aldolase [Streptomyces gardneri]WRK40715.1 bifunctional 4-hydroxy-2-oxoglutarate aldolase/2-dehydro-3-deoxy-phosphogluconate aldolase [Streptomyces venezuelae]CUM36956.1 4-Hydroxy-2-oxoglutarate aldolase @ 2-d
MTSSYEGLRAALAATPVIAILRSASATRFPEVTDTLFHVGVRAAEFTLTTPGVLDALREYAADAPPGLALGAGTVTTPAEAQAAVEAGATYLITPVACTDVIAEAVRLDVPVLPGAYTPTEILTAWRAGATMVKLFPAGTGGPEYLRAVRAPLPHIPLVPTGGISAADAPAYLAAGAAALGIGSPLVGDACESGSLAALTDRAAAFLDEIRRGTDR